MAIFDDITLTWDDEDYLIRGDDKIMMLLAQIEDHVTLHELSTGKPKMTAIAQGYAAALKFAGAKVTVAEVYASLFSGEGEGTTAALTGLLTMMVPPSTIKSDPEEAKKKSQKTSKKR